MNQKGFTNIILIVVLAVIALGAGGYILFDRKLPAPSPAPTPAPMPSPTPLPTPNPTPTPAPTPSPGPVPTSDPTNEPLTVALGATFTLRKNQVATIAGTGLEIEIKEFFNSPCPKGAYCIWSGVGTAFEYRLNGEIKNGIDLTEAFGYHLTIVKTDHQTYATLSVKKAQ